MIYLDNAATTLRKPEAVIEAVAGGEEDSWKSLFEAEGYEVTCVLKGLGEYKGIQKLYAEHAKNAKPL